MKGRMAGGESLIFRSQSYLFALTSPAVAGVSEQQDLPGISFSRYFFAATEQEPHRVILTEGYVLYVKEVVELSLVNEMVLPVPSYLFHEDNSEWLRGILWFFGEPVLLLSDTYLSKQLAEHVPEFSA
jgi:hypothetical protein